MNSPPCTASLILSPSKKAARVSTRISANGSVFAGRDNSVHGFRLFATIEYHKSFADLADIDIEQVRRDHDPHSDIVGIFAGEVGDATTHDSFIGPCSASAVLQMAVSSP
jgi:hypothetical protein